jgi:hypothetical protein
VILPREHAESYRSCESLRTCEHPSRISAGIVRLLGTRSDKSLDDNTLLENLVNAWFCKSSDPRDSIYAFLHLSTNRFGICPDYSITTLLSDVCFQLARNLMMHYSHLNILRSSYLPENMHFTRDPCFMSWVRDYRQSRNDETRLDYKDIHKLDASFSFPVD